MRTSPILEALFPEVRAKVLAATFGQPDREWYVTELARALETQPSSLQRELEALSKAGILEQRRDGRRVYLKPDRSSPVFADLKHLLEKTAGLIPVLAVSWSRWVKASAWHLCTDQLAVPKRHR
jgi:DNA-binding transcriptional ArsR family regulator